MADLIDRQAAIDFIDAGHLCNPNEPRWSDNEIVNFLKSRPSAQSEITLESAIDYLHSIGWMQEHDRVFTESAQPEQKTGRWEYVDYGGFGNWHCTACRKICICNGDYDFCPNCGARMDNDGE